MRPYPLRLAVLVAAVLFPTFSRAGVIFVNGGSFMNVIAFGRNYEDDLAPGALVPEVFSGGNSTPFPFDDTLTAEGYGTLGSGIATSRAKAEVAADGSSFTADLETTVATTGLRTGATANAVVGIDFHITNSPALLQISWTGGRYAINLTPEGEGLLEYTSLLNPEMQSFQYVLDPGLHNLQVTLYSSQNTATNIDISSGTLHVAIVPEASSLLMGTFGIMIIGAAIRRRRTRA